MLRILGSRRTLCNGVSRRDMLTAGGLTAFGLGLGDYFQLAEAQAARASSHASDSFGRAKNCILLYLYGSPSQLEMFDMKPDAPVEVRGTFKPIASSLPGESVCELLPRVSRVMDRVTVVRSMTHPYPIHSASYALTGLPQTETPLDLNPRDPRHWPFIGSVLDYLWSARRDGPIPDDIALPFPLSSRRPAAHCAGFQAAFLGNGHAPVWTEFTGAGTQRVVRPQFSNNQAYEGLDPYLGITPDDRFDFGGGERREDLTLDRLAHRRSLLEQFNHSRDEFDRSALGRGLDRHRQKAFSLLSSDKVRAAMDLGREPRALREAYGMTLFGQSTLLARRLVESGCRFVSVVWDEYGTINTAWDTHSEHFERMQNELMPGFDAAFSSLIQDLDSRGLLDETLVLCTSEHGRSPKIASSPGGGRDHWSQCYSNLLAGGGIARGRVVGKSDRVGGSVMERPISPKDILATVYHLLGIDPHTVLPGAQGRPFPLLASGEVAYDLLA